MYSFNNNFYYSVTSNLQLTAAHPIISKILISDTYIMQIKATDTGHTATTYV